MAVQRPSPDLHNALFIKYFSKLARILLYTGRPGHCGHKQIGSNSK
jgi:hypothetical protein